MKVNKPQTEAEKSTKTTVDTICFSAQEAEAWDVPGFQREVRVNKNVEALAKAIGNDGGVIPGILSFAVVKTLANKRFLIDGLQRRQAFLISGKKEGFADIRTVFCDTLAEAANEFVALNSPLVAMKPDDMLRAMESSNPCLQHIRQECPYVGYDTIRRGGQAVAVVSMSALLRNWFAGCADIPGGTSYKSAKSIAENLCMDDAKQLVRFVSLCRKAWGNDQQYFRLWTALNFVMCVWLFKRVVLSSYSAKGKRIDEDLFCKLLMSLSADPVYLDWLMGRRLSEKERGPCYRRVKDIFIARLRNETGDKWQLPQPPWC